MGNSLPDWHSGRETLLNAHGPHMHPISSSDDPAEFTPNRDELAIALEPWLPHYRAWLACLLGQAADLWLEDWVAKLLTRESCHSLGQQDQSCLHALLVQTALATPYPGKPADTDVALSAWLSACPQLAGILGTEARAWLSQSSSPEG